MRLQERRFFSPLLSLSSALLFSSQRMKQLLVPTGWVRVVCVGCVWAVTVSIEIRSKFPRFLVFWPVDRTTVFPNHSWVWSGPIRSGISGSDDLMIRCVAYILPLKFVEDSQTVNSFWYARDIYFSRKFVVIVNTTASTAVVLASRCHRDCDRIR